MLKTESVNYINSLAKMLSSFASATGSSVIAAEAYGKKNYLTEFVSRYEIPAEKLALVPSEEKLSELLKRWFCGEGKSSAASFGSFDAASASRNPSTCWVMIARCCRISARRKTVRRTMR